MNQNRPYKRVDRINGQVLEILGSILIKHIDLDYLGFVTFTKVDISPDLRHARVHYSVLNCKVSKEKIDIEINSKRKAFKKFLSPELSLKNIPDLRFYFDDTLEYSDSLNVVFQKIKESKTRI